MANILIIDDETGILQLMSKVCKRQGHTTYTCLTGKEGMEKLDAISPELMIVDLKIGDMLGLDIIEHSQKNHPNTRVIMVTGHGSVDSAVQAMKLGAFDYLTKPFELADLQRTINLALKNKAPGEVSNPSYPTITDANELELQLSHTQLVGESEKIKEILTLVEKIANHHSPVLIEGEFGSGKQMVARHLHNISDRNPAPFKVLQCSSLPEDLLEVELFGHPSSESPSIFQRAAGGTVVLEEINVLPLRLQAQLESYLEQSAARRMQSPASSQQEARLITTSTLCLEKAIADGSFREDLYYKLSIIPVPVPALRERQEDISLLIQYFLERHSKATQNKAYQIDTYARKLLEHYRWPGNVGELQNAIERACCLCEKNQIRPADLPPKVTQNLELPTQQSSVTQNIPLGESLSDYIRKQERLFIRETLKFNGGSREKTAGMLGVSIATLYRKMGLKIEREKALTES
ncbi:MAG: sigma-54 dependent transcriptional regulator [Verrucomicrobiales bacterium]|nr:sigma-54 dependent transcriptional regulator [Verrucomicrobiales bacterium]